jgi:membrane protein DedA with SNARE-associated domain
MHDLMTLIAQHGYLLVSSIVFAEAIGLPVPAAIGLVGAGAASASGILQPGLMLVSVLISMMAGDTLLFVLGRYTGWTLLGLLCRVSVNPESCILRSAESFYRRGKMTLMVAKFIPGVNTMAPPLAGSMRMRASQFLRLDFVGASLYILAYFGVGFVFRDFLATITQGLQTAGRAMEEILVAAILAYIVYRIWLYQKNAVYRVVPRVQVEELARRLASDTEQDVLVADVRSHGYYDPGTARIKGSVRLEPNNLAEELKNFPKDKDIYLYCT